MPPLFFSHKILSVFSDRQNALMNSPGIWTKKSRKQLLPALSVYCELAFHVVM